MPLDDKPRRRSGGPRTPEGKARSAQNARKHGLCSDLLLLSVEERAALDELDRAFTAEYRPVGPTEEHLVREMVAAAWREHRCQGIETASIDLTMHRDQQDVDAGFDIMDGASRAALAVEHRSPDAGLLVNFARYETSFHRIFHRALNQLLALQDRRKGQTPPVPQPEPDLQIRPEPKLRNELPRPRPSAARELRPSIRPESSRAAAPG